MNPNEYEKMFRLEDTYWWFVARRRLALELWQRAQEGIARPKVLDVGCGTGVLLSDLSSRAEAYGLDRSPLALDFCKRRGLELLVQGDATQLPFDNASMDSVIGLDVFEHVEDDRGALSEALRILRPGGALVLTVPAFRFLWGPHDVALMHFRRYRVGDVRNLLQGVGFQVERISYSVFLLFPVVVLWRIAEKCKRGPARASLIALPPWLNSMLIRVQSWEAVMIRHRNLPWGSTVIAVARKPAPASQKEMS